MDVYFVPVIDPEDWEKPGFTPDISIHIKDGYILYEALTDSGKPKEGFTNALPSRMTMVPPTSLDDVPVSTNGLGQRLVWTNASLLAQLVSGQLDKTGMPLDSLDRSINYLREMHPGRPLICYWS